MFDVMQIVETAWGMDEFSMGRFDSVELARQFIRDYFDGDFPEEIYIQDDWGGVVE